MSVVAAIRSNVHYDVHYFAFTMNDALLCHMSSQVVYSYIYTYLPRWVYIPVYNHLWDIGQSDVIIYIS